MLVQRFEPQGRHFTNFHYYYYVMAELATEITLSPHVLAESLLGAVKSKVNLDITIRT